MSAGRSLDARIENLPHGVRRKRLYGLLFFGRGLVANSARLAKTLSVLLCERLNHVWIDARRQKCVFCEPCDDLVASHNHWRLR